MNKVFIVYYCYNGIDYMNGVSYHRELMKKIFGKETDAIEYIRGGVLEKQDELQGIWDEFPKIPEEIHEGDEVVTVRDDSETYQCFVYRSYDVE